MKMLPKRFGTSFTLTAKMFCVAEVEEDIKYLESHHECENALSALLNIDFLDNEGKVLMVKELINKSDWLELKPNFFGIGINFNKILNDIIQIVKSLK